MDRIGKNLKEMLKTDIHYVVHNATILGLGHALASISGLVLTLGLVRFLDQVEYGQYMYVLSVAGILSAFTLSGMDSAVAQSIARGYTGALHEGFKKKLLWSIPPSFLSLCAGCYYLFQEDKLLGISLIAIGITSPLLYASTLYTAYFNGKKQFKKIAHDNAWKNVAITLTILIVAFYTKSALFTILAYLVSSTIISITRYAILFYTVDHGTTNAETNTLGTHLSVMEGLTAFAGYIDKIVVFQLLGATPLALYSIALAPIKQIHSISKIIKTLVLPKYSVRSERELREATPRRVLLFSMLSIIIIGIYWLISELFFVRLFPQYESALVYSQVLSLSILFIPTVFYVQALTALSKTRELYVLNIVKCISKIVLLIIFVPFLKIWGAIISFVGMHLVTLVTAAILFKRNSP